MQLPSLLKVCMCDTYICGLISLTVFLLTFSVNDCVNFSVSSEAVCMYCMYICTCVAVFNCCMHLLMYGRKIC